MKLTVIHPTCRHAKAAESARRWRESADANGPEFEYILVGDTEATEEERAALAGVVTSAEFLPPRPGYVYKLNRAGQMATGDIIVETHDDIIPPQGWNTLLAEALPGSGPAVLRVAHGGDREKSLCVPMIFNRAWYERHRFVSHPALVHLYADDYFTWQAQEAGVIREAQHIVFRHDHPYFKPEGAEREAAMDDTYRANYAEQRWMEDGETFERLKDACRPMDETETLQIHVPVANRFELARECVSLLRARSPQKAQIIVWIDGVEGQKHDWPGATIVYETPKLGIEKQRVQHLKFWAQFPSTWLYFTDADAVHAADWFTPMRKLAIETTYLVSGYRTGAHANDVYEDCGAYLKHHYVAGVSMLMHETHVNHILGQKLSPEGEIRGQMGGFDWTIPEWLGHRCITPWCSYVDHVGVNGMHHGQDHTVGHGDRAMHPVGDLDARVRMLWEKGLRA